MKILVLTKRQTTNNDVIDNKFGRSWEFPYELAKLSNKVYGFCLSYKNKTEGSILFDKEVKNASVSWCSINAGKAKPLGFLRYSFRVYNFAKKVRPDVIFSMSDSIYAILGSLIARRLDCVSLIDLQDNYEAYSSYKIPFIPKLFKKAILKADAVLCVSGMLKDYMAANYSKTINYFVVENGISNKSFYSMDKNFCRNKLDLPLDATIIGISGSLYRDRGIKIIFDGFKKLKKKHKKLYLAVAGARNLEIPKNERIHDFGLLEHNEVKCFINALDTAIICNKDSLQYTYGFPIKAFEAIACSTPLVAAKIGPLTKYFDMYPECFFNINEVDSFCRAIEYQLNNQQLFNIKVNTWKDLSKDINSYLKSIA